MEDTPRYRTASTVQHALLPDAIIGSIVLTHPKERVLVMGRAADGVWCLARRGGQHRVSVSSGSQPTPGRRVHGYLSVKPKRSASGVEILLTGDAVDTWTPKTNSPRSSRARDLGTPNTPRLRAGAPAGVPLGTQHQSRSAGLSHRARPTGSVGPCLSPRPGPFRRPHKLLADIDRALIQHPTKPLAFVRGDGDGFGSFVGDDPVFVCALIERRLPLAVTQPSESDRFSRSSTSNHVVGNPLETRPTHIWVQA